jgi:hypothetical protein
MSPYSSLSLWLPKFFSMMKRFILAGKGRARGRRGRGGVGLMREHSWSGAAASRQVTQEAFWNASLAAGRQ